MVGNDLETIKEKHKYNHFFNHMVEQGLKGSILDIAASMYNAAYSDDFDENACLFVAFGQNDKYLQKAKKACAKNMPDNETPIFMIDLSGAIFESSRWEKAILLTDKNLRFGGGAIPLRDIDEIVKDDGAFSHNLIINGQKISVPIAVWDKIDPIIKYITAFADIVKYLPSDRKEVPRSNAAIAENPHTLSSLQNLITQILNADKKLSEASALYFCGRSTKDNQKADKALSSYGVKLAEDEIPLCCYDDTMFGSASEGFVLTSQNTLKINVVLSYHTSING